MSVVPISAAPAPAPQIGEPSPAWLLVAQAADLAAQIAGTEFVPEAMRNNPAAVAACMLYGAEIGIGPMQSLAKIDIVKGRPAPRAELARALALAAGHEVWIPEGEQTNTRCTVKGRRRGTSNVFSTTWTMDDVRKAGIHGHMYAKYPRQMLLARASAELVRMMAPDCLGGIAYFAEELADGGADPLEDDTAIEPATATATPPKQTRQRRPPAQPTVAAVPEPDSSRLPSDQPLLPDEEPGEPLATDAQIKKLATVFGEIGIKERDDRLRFITLAARPVESSRDLTVAECSKVIERAQGVVDGSWTLTIEDGSMALAPVDDGEPASQPPLPEEENTDG